MDGKLSSKHWFQKTGDRVLDMLFPRFCVRCGREGAACCGPCLEAYVPRLPEAACPFCGKEGSDRTCEACAAKTYLDGLTAFGSYGDPVVRQALTTWKYVGDVAYREVIERWVRGVDAVPPVSREAPLVPVPLHETRRRERGFDQAETFADWMRDMSGRPLARLLTRTRRTAPQAQRGHTERLVGDLDDVFRVRVAVPSAVILCDDVFTSGATMDAAAKCLKDAGASLVWGLVIAKG